MSTDEIPSGSLNDDEYVSRTGTENEAVPVQKDGAAIEESAGDNANRDSDEQLGMSSNGHHHLRA